MRTLIEVCAGTVESCFTAWRVGAHRVELCSALALGGLTPSFGAIEICKNETLIDIYVLIRPRQGDFLYEREDVKVMLRDIEMCGRLKVAGVVIGALDKHGKVDIEVCKQMIDTARSHGLGVTFQTSTGTFTKYNFNHLIYLRFNYSRMNKLYHAKQFLLPGCECYYNAAPIPFVEFASIPLSRPRWLSSAP